MKYKAVACYDTYILKLDSIGFHTKFSSTNHKHQTFSNPGCSLSRCPVNMARGLKMAPRLGPGSLVSALALAAVVV